MDDVEHTVFKCTAGENIRREALRGAAGATLNPATLVDEMTKSKERWRQISKVIEAIIRQKEKTERTHQKAGVQGEEQDQEGQTPTTLEKKKRQTQTRTKRLKERNETKEQRTD